MWTQSKNPGKLFWCSALLAFALILHGSRKTLAQETENVKALETQLMELSQSGKYEQAVPIAKQVLEIREKTLGPEHPNTATSLDNLALLYKSMGNYAKAEPLLQRALKITTPASHSLR